ncbi:PA4780 family RIO1-like protein kinase [Simiduia aestuariiviva]|uniref:non-specific serine/threonine protein kinase n=1 Tax=Simiduia aestuariiviva TaxID=1510459 RepID=A0A839UT20_9GAMM|nr:PA4780 family RIO1-like protein kinase [Simiduia aestuariiviva]MBB3168648.1 RIO kinase 1 [Simiduia aestuariiviva]
MKVPKRLQPLVADGVIDEVIYPLMSGKEAQVFVVRVGDQYLCAKVYKESKQRSFKQAAVYQEGRGTRNSRRARAMQKKSKFGQKESEQAWLSAEVDALYRLAEAEVRVPTPHGFVDGVLLMDLITDEHGDPAPRLDDVEFDVETAAEFHRIMMQEIVRMLCAGLVHGDLSPFNVLVEPEGPVIIDLPQAVNAAGNNSAKMMLVRDINNMTRFFGQFDTRLLTTHYAEEIWHLYERGDLHPDSTLTGESDQVAVETDIATMLRIIEDAREEEADRQARMNASDEDDY